MLVLSLTDCPSALRGDLSRWLMEIDTGVYVGQVSARVREALWERVTAHLKTGRAVLVFNAGNEQKMDFRVHNASWEPIDFDGLKLMLRPSDHRLHEKQAGHEPMKSGYSLASKMRRAKQASRPKLIGLPPSFVVIDLETTGLKPDSHHLLELGALRYQEGEEVARFQALIRQPSPLPHAICELTGLTDDKLLAEGKPLEEALPEFLSFIAQDLLVSHNIAFDMEFLSVACALLGLPLPANRRMDTLQMARRFAREAVDHKLVTLTRHFSLPHESPHRSLSDCQATFHLLCKLIEIRDASR